MDAWRAIFPDRPDELFVEPHTGFHAPVWAGLVPAGQASRDADTIAEYVLHIMDRDFRLLYYRRVK